MSYQNSEKIVEKELSYKLGGIFLKIQKRLGRFYRESQKAANKDLGLIINFRDKYLKPKRVLNSEYSDKFVVSNRSKGFTLFELIITIAIIGILAGIVVAVVPTMGRGRELEMERDKIVAYLRYAREKSVSQEEGRQWGVRFDNTNTVLPNYKLFHSLPYSPANVRETIFLSNRVQFNDPSGGNFKDIIFTKITGTTTATSVTIALRNTGQTKTASTSAEGVVTSN